MYLKQNQSRRTPTGTKGTAQLAQNLTKLTVAAYPPTRKLHPCSLDPIVYHFIVNCIVNFIVNYIVNFIVNYTVNFIVNFICESYYLGSHLRTWLFF